MSVESVVECASRSYRKGHVENGGRNSSVYKKEKVCENDGAGALGRSLIFTYNFQESPTGGSRCRRISIRLLARYRLSFTM